METKFIVVPIDFTATTKNALKYAVRLASDCGQEILALHLLDDRKDLIEKEGLLKYLVQHIENIEGVPITTRVIEGDIDADIAKIAEGVGASLVVLGMHEPNFFENVIGSNTIAMLRHSKVPYLILQEYSEYRPINKIGVSIDTNKESTQIVISAAELAKVIGASVDLIGGKQSNLDLAKRLDINLKIAKDYLIKRAVDYKTVLILNDDFGTRLTEYCHENRIELIAVTYHADTLPLFSNKFVQHLMQNNYRIPVLTKEDVPVSVGTALNALPA